MAKVGRPKSIKPSNDESETIEKVEKVDNLVDLVEKETAGEPPTNAIPLSAKDANVIAEQMKERRKLPTIPGGDISLKEYLEWQKLLTSEHWEHILIYVYRSYPIIVRKLVGDDNPNYIDKISQPITRQDLVANYGGGKYDLWFNDTDKPKNPQFLIRVNIPLSEAEPILNYAELDLGRKENGAYIATLIQKGLIDGKGKIMTPQMQANQANQSNADAMMGMVREFMTMVKTMNQEQVNSLKRQLSPEDAGLGKSIGDILLEKMKQDDPSKMISIFTSLLSAIKPNESKAADNQANMLDKIVEMFKEQNKLQMEMMKIQFEALKTAKGDGGEGGSGADEFDKLTKILDFAERIKGPRSGGSRGGWDVAIDVAREVASPLLTALGNLFMMKMQGQSVQPMQPVISNNPGNPSNPGNPTPPALPMPSNPNPANPSNPNSNLDPNSSITPEIAQLIPVIHQYGNMIITQGLQAKKGYDFAADLVQFYGIAPYAMVSKYGEDNLIAAMKAVPEFWSTVDAAFGEFYVKQWVNDFIHYEERLAELEGDGEEDEEDITGGNTLTTPENKPIKKGRLTTIKD